jgi:membrane protease YdiL (CAAX protease family)
MLGLLAALVISWLLLWLVAKQHPGVLGLKPRKTRGLELVFGLLTAGAVCAIYHLSAKYFAGNRWVINPAYTASAFVKSSFWALKSVLLETLIYQGALLYLAIQKLGIRKACLLSAACFGVYHWFAYEAFGNPVQMAFIFFMTAIMGLTFAFAFAKTRSLYLPIALHFGWNLVNIVVFSNGPLGKQLLLQQNHEKLQGIPSLLVFLFQVLAIPAITYFYLKGQAFRP